MQINLVTNVGNASNLHVLLDSDIQDFAHITLRYRSKISSAEAFSGDLKLRINGCCKEKKSKREKALRFRSFTEGMLRVVLSVLFRDYFGFQDTLDKP